jgi:hypothetical protein
MGRFALENGPFPLDADVIDLEVPADEKGAYALGSLTKKNSIIVLRIGRSDSDLNGRLKSYLTDPAYDECTHFFFELFPTRKKAFEAECFLFHDYDPDLNENHPGRPEGTDYCCPVADDDECPPCSDEN